MDQMEKKERKTKGMMFMDQQQCTIEEIENENAFEMEEMAPYPNTEELPGIESNTTQDEMEVAETDPGEDLIDLAEISAENAWDIDVIEEMPVNQLQSKQDKWDVVNHEPDTQNNEEKEELQNHASLEDNRENECEPDQ